ncbi:MAG: tetratricopeptide repeat protein [Aureispira sp.]|nr:tetratricopeptide repeat protein [Aureispira sp.]
MLIGLPQMQAQSAATMNAFKQSYAQEKEGKYSDAIKTLKGVYDEKSYELNLRLGWLHYMAGRFSESTTYYQKCIEMYPMAIEPKLGFVYPAAALGSWDKVGNQYKDILAIDPNNTVVNYRVGLMNYGKKDYKSAAKYFEKVLNLYPFDYDSLLMLGWTKYFLGDSAKAKALFNKVLLYSPDDKSAKEGLDLIK